jgi:hypothetical protein
MFNRTMSLFEHRGHLPSPYGDHFRVGSHEQLGTVPHLVTFYTNPLVLGPVGVQRKQEGFAGAEVRLSVAPVVLLVSFTPARRAVCAEHLKPNVKSIDRSLDPNS